MFVNVINTVGSLVSLRPNFVNDKFNHKVAIRTVSVLNVFSNFNCYSFSNNNEHYIYLAPPVVDVGVVSSTYASEIKRTDGVYCYYFTDNKNVQNGLPLVITYWFSMRRYCYYYYYCNCRAVANWANQSDE